MTLLHMLGGKARPWLIARTTRGGQSVIVNAMVPITLGSYSSWPGLSK